MGLLQSKSIPQHLHMWTHPLFATLLADGKFLIFKELDKETVHLIKLSYPILMDHVGVSEFCV